MHVCILSKMKGVNENKQVYLPHKRYLSDPGLESNNMAASYEIFVTVICQFVGFCQNKYNCQTRDI